MNIKKVKVSVNKILSLVNYEAGYYLNTLFSNPKDGANTSVIIASAHKVGSTWLHKILRDFYIYRYRRVPIEFRTSVYNRWELSLGAPEVFEFLNNQTSRNIYKSHSLPPPWEPTSSVKIITIFRDPRDIVISNIFYLANLDPKQGGWRDLADMDTKSRIRRYLDKATFDIDLLEKWGVYPDVYRTSYETLLKDTLTETKNIASYINAQVDEKRIERAVQKNTFRRLSIGRNTGNEDTQSFFRKGISGDWLNYFDEELVDYFKQANSGRWNRLLVNLGYEDSLDWTPGSRR